MQAPIQTMKPRILLVVTDLGPGGSQAMNMQLAKELINRGWSVDIAVLFNRWRVLGKDLCKNLNITILGQDRFPDKVMLPLRLFSMARKVDLILGGAEQASSTYAWLSALITGKPFVAWVHNSFHLHLFSLSRYDRFIVKTLYRKTRYVVFVSTGARDSLLACLGRKPPQATWHVVENFLTRTAMPRKTKPLDPRVASKPIILGVGRLATQKAFDRLIRAHAKLLKMGLDQHLVILGEGPKRTELLREAQRLGVAATTFFPGHVSNVPDWLEHATIFALCSKYEGLPLVILEAMAAGTPIVAMDCPSGPREMLQDGYAGLLVPEGDETAFTEALAALLTSPELRARYSERGRQRAVYYCPERIVPQWESLLKEIARS